MLKIISLFILSVIAFAQNIKVFATYANEQNNTIVLHNPLIIYKDYIIQAKKGIIKNDKSAIFEGNVVIYYQNSAIESDRVEVLSKDNIFAEKNIIYYRKLDVWFKTYVAKLNGDKIRFKKVFFSSCCINNPDWYLYASKGTYNKKTKYMRLYNIVLYIHEVPVFYFPFYFNSLDKKRRSGLLRPYFGYSSKEGILYTQPIYIVLGTRADLELDPTIRTQRGKGIYATLRFVDSPNSYGEFKAGIFEDSNSYFESNDLANKQHYGYEFLYRREKILNPKDKLYVDLKYANDVDYFYLNPFNYTFDTSYLIDKTITSEINYLLPFKSEYIFGMYAKYFIDTSKLSNRGTIQILPQLNLHKFVTKHFLLSSFDANFYHYYSVPTKYYKFDMLLPISYYKRIFNDYLSYKITESFNFATSNYYNSNSKADVFTQAYTSFEIYSSLIKRTSFIHIINPSIVLNLNNYYKLRNENNLLGEMKINDSVSFKLFQIYEKDKIYLDHTLLQTLYIDDNKKNSMENTINFKYDYFSLNLNNKYSWEDKKIIYNATSIKYSNDEYLLKMTHIYKYATIANEKLKTITFRAEKSLGDYRRFYYESSYDLNKNYNKYFLIGVNKKKKCWTYDIGFKRNRIPVLKEDGISFRDDYILNLNVYFYPIGGLRQSILLN